MSTHVFKLPDLGEGTVSAEIVAWHVKPGDVLKEDQPLVEMSTDKAVVEVPSPVSGRVLSLAGKPGDVVAVGAQLATFDTAGTANDPAAAVIARLHPPPRQCRRRRPPRLPPQRLPPAARCAPLPPRVDAPPKPASI